MGRRKATDAPKYRRHASGLAVCKIEGRDYYLGQHGTTASQDEYWGLIARWRAGELDRPDLGIPSLVGGVPDATVAEVAALYLEWAPTAFRKRGGPTSHIRKVANATGRWAAAHGGVRVARYGPKLLGEWRDGLVAEGLSRKTVNEYATTVLACLRWACEKEHCDPAAWHRLAAFTPLRAGRTEAPEDGEVAPADAEAVARFVAAGPEPLRSMVAVQRWTGMRRLEVVGLAAADLDRGGEVWAYRVRADWNKAAHHRRARTVWVGPRAQAVLLPWLAVHPDGRVFRSRRGLGWTPGAYGDALLRACLKLGVAPFSPSQLRHLAATEIRAGAGAEGLDAARTVLGHGDSSTTAIYAMADAEKAKAVALLMG